jgi:hypothetical protein
MSNSSYKGHQPNHAINKTGQVSSCTTLPFMNLPFEIRQQIYELIVPCNANITIRSVFEAPSWKTHYLVGNRSQTEYAAAGITNLSRLNRAINEEVVRLLYHSNLFIFEIRYKTGNNHRINRTPGFMGIPAHAMQRMRRIRLDISGNLGAWFVYNGFQAELKRFVRIIDSRDKHALESVEVKLWNNPSGYSIPNYSFPSYFAGRPGELYAQSMAREDRLNSAISLSPITPNIHQRCLEPLANLYGLTEVNIHGSITPQFAQSLSMIMKGHERQESAKAKLTLIVDDVNGDPSSHRRRNHS